MNTFKKTIRYIMYPLLVISLCLNLYCFIKNNSSKAVVKVDGKTILTKKELDEELLNHFKITIINQHVSNYLLTLEAKNLKISEPTNEDLYEIVSKFPSLAAYAKDIEKNRDTLTEGYFIYELFKLDNIEPNLISTFLEERYGDRDTKLYEISMYETHDHTHAVEIENLLKEEHNISELEEQFNINFFTSYVTSIDNIIGSGNTDSSTNTSEHIMSDLNMNTENNEELSTDNKNELNTAVDKSNKTNYAAGDIFHVMDSEEMKIIQINKILNIENNIEQFKDLYFAQKFTSIKNGIINSLKGKYIVSYY